MTSERSFCFCVNLLFLLFFGVLVVHPAMIEGRNNDITSKLSSVVNQRAQNMFILMNFKNIIPCFFDDLNNSFNDNSD